MAHSDVTTAYIGLGSNLGDKRKHIETALQMLNAAGGIDVSATSDILQTKSLSSSVQADYANAVVKIATTLLPNDLLSCLNTIEDKLGRVRDKKWGDRTIDLDLIFYGDQVIKTDRLTVPHKQMHLRSFVLNPMQQLASDFVHPVLNRTMDSLAARLNGNDFFIDEQNPQLISVAGVIGVGKTTLATALAEKLSCELILEQYEENPFLADVYAGKTDLALDSELFFLNSSASQFAPADFTPAKTYVSDFMFYKAVAYAKLWLSEKQFAEYQNHYKRIAEAVVKPSLIIYLCDKSENCLDRIHKRHRPYEQDIEIEFLDRLQAQHESLFKGWPVCPIMQLSVSDFDARDETQVETIAEEIKNYLLIK